VIVVIVIILMIVLIAGISVTVFLLKAGLLPG